MSQNLPLDGFNWVAETSHFNEDSIKSNNKYHYLLKLMFSVQKNCMNFIIIYPFCLKE